MKYLLYLALLLPAISVAEPFLIEKGQPRAEIIIPEAPTRTQRLAARELQTYLEKISGAELDILTTPSGSQPIKLYIGSSKYTDAFGITGEGLLHGAYRGS